MLQNFLFDFYGVIPHSKVYLYTLCCVFLFQIQQKTKRELETMKMQYKDALEELKTLKDKASSPFSFSWFVSQTSHI